MTSYIQLTFPDLQPEQKDILIARLSEAGFEGFEETDTSLLAFIPKEKFDGLLTEETAFKYQVRFTQKEIAYTNWNQQWESGFHPVIINDFAAIRADFHAPVYGVKHEIIITPKMSFGTGHHATTYMMIEQMQDIDFTGKKVFDFGTGTGVLAILAEKKGASGVIATDIDEWSIENAKENVKNNNCRSVEIIKSHIVPERGKADIILANINKNVILGNLPTLSEYLSPEGILVISGILSEDKKALLTAAEVLNLKLEKELIRNNWISLKFLC